MDDMDSTFKDLHQGTMSVREYEEEFSRLSQFASSTLNKQELMRRFLNGLRMEFHSRCSLVEYNSLIQLVVQRM